MKEQMQFISAATATRLAPYDRAAQRAAFLRVRQPYDGRREIRPTETFYALLCPRRRYV